MEEEPGGEPLANPRVSTLDYVNANPKARSRASRFPREMRNADRSPADYRRVPRALPRRSLRIRAVKVNI